MSDYRFGIGLYGSTQYGVSSFERELLAWGVQVDWDGDGVFDGTNETSRMVDIHGARGRSQYISSDGAGFEKVATGRYYVTLDNTDGRYDAWNAASPLYPNVTYGRDCRIVVRHLETGIIYPVFYGVIEDIQPQNDVDGNREVVLTIADGWNYLRNYSGRVSIQTNITPDSAISKVLDSVNWPQRWGRLLAASPDHIAYFWANGNEQAATVIEDIAASFLGYFYIDNQGRARFSTRATVNPVGELTADQMLKDISLPQPWANSRNVTRVKVHPRIAAASGVIYTLVSNTPVIQPGAANALVIWATYTYNGTQVPATAIVNPVATTDYTANTQSNGSGTDKTAQIAVTVTDFGDTCKIVVQNNDASSVYLTKLQLRGQALYEPNTSDVIYQGGEFATLPRQFTLDLLWQQDVNVATDFSGVIGAFLVARHPFPVVQIEARPELQFAFDLFDVISLTIPAYGIEGDSYRVAYIEHESVSATCQAVRTKLYLEAYIPPTDYFIWDSAIWDSTTIFGA